MSNGGTEVSWTKVAGASGYVIYRNGSAAKTVKSSVSTWKDTKAYDFQTGMYWIYNYYVKAFKTVNVVLCQEKVQIKYNQFSLFM